MNNRMYISDFYCTECGSKNIGIPRFQGKDREPGHLKSMWCMHCKKETNNAEVRGFGKYTKEDFDLEFKLGRFVDGKKIPIAELMHCSKNNCDYNVNGKCWNSAETFDCGHRILKNKEDK